MSRRRGHALSDDACPTCGTTCLALALGGREDQVRRWEPTGALPLRTCVVERDFSSFLVRCASRLELAFCSPQHPRHSSTRIGVRPSAARLSPSPGPGLE